MKYYTLCLATILLFGCRSEPVKDLINPVRLASGITDTLSLDELYYARTYHPSLKQSNHLSVETDQTQNLLICTPEPGFSGVTFIRLEIVDIPVIVETKNKINFRFRPPVRAQAVYVMGTFNSWNRTSDPLSDTDGDGIFETTLSLDEGVYEYQFVYDKVEVWDKQNPDKIDNGFGGYNSLLRVTRGNKENIPYLYYYQGQQTSKITIAINSGSATTDLNLYMLLDNHLLSKEIWSLNGHTVQIDLSLLPSQGRHCLRIIADLQGNAGNILHIWLNDGQPLPDDIFIWQDAIIYSLMTDRFFDGDSNNNRPVNNPQLDERANFQGGDFSGIINKLNDGYFKDLGINTIWISPVTRTTNKAYQEWPEPKRYYSGYHGYWPVRSDSTEPRFGTMNQFKEIVHIAHDQNIKVLLDFISNHVHIEHPYYHDHPDWFGTMKLPDGTLNIRLWEAYRLTTWFDTFLPSFDYISSRQALETMTDNALFWLKETRIDGFRHDATKHVPYIFWKRLNRKIKANITPERELPVYQIGETFGGHDLIKSYVNNGMLDAQFNFDQFFTARRVFVERRSDFKDLALALEKSLVIYGDNHLMGNIMDSHDQARMIAMLEGDLSLADDALQRAWQDPPVMVDDTISYRKARVFLTYLLTIPGIPIIYYGDEIGMTGAGDPDNRRMMRFDNACTAQERNQFVKVKQLIRVRKNNSSLRRGDYLTLMADKDLFAYSRGDLSQRIVVVLYKGDKYKNITLKLPEWIGTGSLKSLLDREEVEIKNNEVSIGLLPWSARVYVIK